MSKLISRAAGCRTCFASLIGVAASQLELPEDEIHQDEVLTPQALALLRERFPGARELLHEGITRRHLAALLTVSEVARSVESKLAAA